jgi:hypothetical protein
VNVTVGPRECQTAAPCTIWGDNETPSNSTVNDDGQPIEVGVKFRSDTDGFITGLRFYKVTQNTGTHVGHLWSSTGQQLAEATFTAETASGWQKVTFGEPVATAANTTYVASYHSGSGFYSSDQNYFTSAVDNPPLRAVANGTAGPNGVYKYGASGFPTETFNASNYWVDVLFVSEEEPPPPPPDETSPTITPKQPTGKTRDRTPKIVAVVRDGQSELSKEDIKLFVDNKPRDFSYVPSTDKLVHESRKLSYGRHTVEVEATDDAGNKAYRGWSFKVVKRR